MWVGCLAWRCIGGLIRVWWPWILVFVRVLEVSLVLDRVKWITSQELKSIFDRWWQAETLYPSQFYSKNTMTLSSYAQHSCSIPSRIYSLITTPVLFSSQNSMSTLTPPATHHTYSNPQNLYHSTALFWLSLKLWVHEKTGIFMGCLIAMRLSFKRIKMWTGHCDELIFVWLWNRVGCLTLLFRVLWSYS